MWAVLVLFWGADGAIGVLNAYEVTKNRNFFTFYFPSCRRCFELLQSKAQ